MATTVCTCKTDRRIATEGKSTDGILEIGKIGMCPDQNEMKKNTKLRPSYFSQMIFSVLTPFFFNDML